MDERRLSTSDVLMSGILTMPIPETGIPKGRPQVSYDVYDGKPDREELLAAVERGDVLHASEYYGIPHLWKADDGIYRGILLQYRAITEDLTWDSLDDGMGWFIATAMACSD